MLTADITTSRLNENFFRRRNYKHKFVVVSLEWENVRKKRNLYKRIATEIENFSVKYEDSFIHSVFCLTTGPKPTPKRCRHIVRSRAYSFKWEYPLLSIRSSSNFLLLLPLLLATSISPFIFPSITCFKRQFLRKMCPIQLAFRFLISCRIFLCSLILSNSSSFLTWSVQLIFSLTVYIPIKFFFLTIICSHKNFKII